MKAQEADLFDISEEQMKGMYEEIGLLSKKKPDGPVNKFKLKFINEVIAKANNLLGAEYMPLDGFASFDEETLPTASDVVFILSQYLKSMDKFRYDNTHFAAGECYWTLHDGESRKVTRRSTLHFRV